MSKKHEADNETRYDRLLRRAKDHPLIVAFMVLFALVVYFGAVTDSLDKIRNFGRPGEAPIEHVQASLREAIRDLATSDSTQIRIAALYRLGDIARTHLELRDEIVDALATWIRENSGHLNAKRQTQSEHRETQRHAERERVCGPRFAPVPELQEAVALLAKMTSPAPELRYKDPNLKASDLRWIKVPDIEFPGVHLGEAKLQWAILKGATLSRAVLVGADASCAYFNGAHLEAVDFDGADLEYAEFAGATFGCTSTGQEKSRCTDFTNAHMEGARFRNVDLSTVIGLTQGQLDQAQIARGTPLPSGLRVQPADTQPQGQS